jgi:hypothetical protein
LIQAPQSFSPARPSCGTSLFRSHVSGSIGHRQEKQRGDEFVMDAPAGLSLGSTQ